MCSIIPDSCSISYHEPSAGSKDLERVKSDGNRAVTVRKIGE